MRRLRLLLLCGLVGVGCQSDGTTTPLPGYSIDAAAYCMVVSQPGIQLWHRDLVTTCATAATPGDGTTTPCTVSTVHGDGSLQPMSDVTGAQLAYRAAGNAIVLLTDASQLVLRSSGGSMTMIAPWAADPGVSPDGAQVAFLALPPGTTDWSDGVPTHVALYDVASGSVTDIADDDLASNPFPVGDGSVLFVSTRSGLASIFRGRAMQEATQLTNVGLDRVDASFVPVPTRDLVWLPGTHKAVFAAHYTSDDVWTIDADSGATEHLGPGTLPQLTASGTVLAETTMTSDADCASAYLDPAGAP